MSALEQEIIEKFERLEPDAQERVLQLLKVRAQPPFDYDAWWADVKALHITLRPDASGHVPSASELVNEAREERDAEILRSIGFGDSAGDGTN